MERKNIYVPDIPITEDQFDKMKRKYITAKKFYKKAKQKVEIAQQIYKQLTKT